jgi:hypothetical protein
MASSANNTRRALESLDVNAQSGNRETKSNSSTQTIDKSDDVNPRDWNVEAFGSGHVENIVPLLKPIREVVLINKESDGALFRVDTVASLCSTSNQQDVAPDAVVSGQSFCLLAGQQVHLFDADVSNHLATVSLDCQPEIAAISKNSRFIVVGDALGAIHFIHVASQTVVFSQEVAANLVGDKIFCWMNFVGKDTDPTESLVVVMRDFVMLRFSNLNLATVEEALLEQNMSLALKVKTEIKVEPIMLGGNGPHQSGVYDLAFWTMGREERLLVGGKGKFCLSMHRRSQLTNKTMMMDGFSGTDSIKRIQLEPVSRTSAEAPLRSPKWMLVLDGNGQVSIRDCKTLLSLHAPSNLQDICDVMLVSSTTLAILTRFDQRRFIRIISIPDWTVEQEVEVEKDAWFVRRSGQVTLGTVSYVERVDIPGQPSRLAVRFLSETAPQQKLQQLMSRKRWQDALDFVTRFPSLSAHVVYKHKLQDIIAETTSGSSQLDLSVLSELNMVEDCAFVAHFCLRVLAGSLQDTETLLNYAHNIVTGSANDGRSDVPLAESMSSIQRSIKRLGTFQLISSGNFDARQWARFRDADMVQEIRSLLRVGDLPRAALLWRRHVSDDGLVEHVVDILNNLPESMNPKQIYAWLHVDVVPILTREVRPHFASWVERRARLVEGLQKKPHDALQLVGLLVSESVAVVDKSTPMQHVKQIRKHPEARPSNELHAQLDDLVHLWDKHDLQLTLAEYAQETPSSIALELLDRVGAAELIPMAIANNFMPYVEKNDLNADELLSDYAMEVMDDAKTTDLSGAAWETRTLTLLDAISVLDIKVDLILEMMRRSPVPWSQDVDMVIKQSLTWTSAQRVEEIREQYRLMLLKKMLLRHGIKLFNVADLSMAKELLHFIVSRTDLPDAMDDAMMVVNAYHHLSRLDAFASRLRHLCLDNQLDRAVLLLKHGRETEAQGDESLGKLIGDVPFVLHDALTIGQEVVEWSVDVMHEVVTSNEKPTFDDAAKLTFRNALETAVELIRVMVTLKSEGEVNLPTTWCQQARYEEMCNIRSLFYEFDALVTVDDYRRGRARQTLLPAAAKRVFGYAKQKTTDMTESNLYRIAELLNIPRDGLKGLLAEEAARYGDFKTALVLCKGATEKTMDAKAAAVMRNVASRLTGYCANNPIAKDLKATHGRVTHNILSLGRNSLTCAGEDIADSLEAFKAFDLQHAVFLQSDAGDYDEAMEHGNAALDFDHLFPYYKETALVLPVEEALPLASRYAASITDVKPTIVSGKGKGKVDTSTTPLARGKDLAEYLATRRCRSTSLTTFQALFELVVRQEQHLSLESGKNAYLSVMSQLLQTILSSRCMDEVLSLGYMLCLPQEMAFNAFKAGMQTTNQDYHRLLTFGALGQAAGRVWMQRSFQVDCESLSRNAKWWHILRLLNISFDDASFRAKSTDALRELVPCLLSKTAALDTALEFARDYQIEDDCVLFEYIRIQLLLGHVGYENQIAGVLEDVVNKPGLMKLLLEQWLPCISPYDYERLIFGFKLVSGHDRAKHALLVLEILTGYHRKHAPESEELQQSYRWCHGKENLDKNQLLAEFPKSMLRLPFHHIFLKSQGWQFLEKELEVETLGKLLALCIPLQLSSDLLHKTVIDKLVKQIVRLFWHWTNFGKRRQGIL